MSITAKKLGQATLDTSVTTLVTGVTGGVTEVTSIWLVNTGSVSRTVKIYAHGTGSVAENMLFTWTLDPNGGSMLLRKRMNERTLCRLISIDMIF